MTARGAHLVGGIALPDNREAMTAAAQVLGPRLRAIPDGETGARNQWIGWQIANLLGNPGFSMAEQPKMAPSVEEESYAAMPQLTMTDEAQIVPATLGYSAAAIESYDVFRALREEGVIPAGVRFQVSLPTPFAVVVAWGALGQMERLFGLYKAALFEELRTIVGAIPAADLLIQWDIAVEIGVLEHAFAVDESLSDYGRIIAEISACVEEVRRLSPDGEEPVELALHLCYGDYHHRHFKVPEDLRLLTTIANDAYRQSPYELVHMPVDRDAGRNPEYFAPLRDLTDKVDLALGLIDYENDPAVIDLLVSNADRVGRSYAVATECGMARVGERGEAVTVEDLLLQHARVSEDL